MFLACENVISMKKKVSYPDTWARRQVERFWRQRPMQAL
jgi:hypothetical protein